MRELRSSQSWRCTISCLPASKSPLVQSPTALVRALCDTRAGNSSPRASYFLVSADKRRDLVFGKFRRWCAMDHGVRVLHTNAICSHVRFHDIHDGVVSVLVRPIALPLQQSGEYGYRFCAGLNHSLHCVVVIELANVSAGIFNDEDFVAIV